MDEDTKQRFLRELRYEKGSGLFWWNLLGRGRCKNRPAGNLDPSSGYLRIMLGGKKYYGHRVAFLLVEGVIPQYIDHINGDKGDNRWCNLRGSTNSQNAANSKLTTSNSSGYKGVHWDTERGKWLAQIMFNYKSHFLGRYDCPIEAHEAYKKAAEKYFGEFARYE